MKTIDVVGAVILNEKNEVLCALRSQSMSLPGLWEFPGGKIEANEDPKETLAREIREELNCDIQVGEIVADVHHQYPGMTVHLLTYYAQIEGGEPTATEHEKIMWLPIDRVDSLVWAPADIPTVDRLLGRLSE